MQPPVDHRRRTLRLALVGLAVLVLLSVVAFASRSGFGGHSSTARPSPGYVSWAITLFLILFVVLIPFAAWAYTIQAQERLVQKRTSFQWRVLKGFLTIIILMLVALGASYLKRHGHLFSLFGGQRNGRPGVTGGVHADRAPAPYSPTFKWPVLWATLGLLAALAVGYWWWLRRHKDRLLGAPYEAEPTMVEDLAASIGDAIDDLEAEPDARRAVVAAYARMEATFARHGLRRHPSETPVEYLRRILLGITARGEAVRRLTGLFEQAKFSHHEIDAGMKRDAIASLREIRADLQSAAT